MIERLKAVESRVLLGLAALVGMIWGVLALAGAVNGTAPPAMDRRLLLAFRDPHDLSRTIGPRWLDQAMRDVTALGGVTVLTLVVAVAAALLLIHRRRRQAFVLVGTVLAAQAVSGLLKGAYDRARPELVPHEAWVYDASFPSGHSTLAAATWLTLAAVVASLENHLRSKLLVFGVATLVVAAVGISRVYLGVHWPSDVLAGWMLGAGWALAGWLTLGGERNRRRNG